MNHVSFGVPFILVRRNLVAVQHHSHSLQFFVGTGLFVFILKRNFDKLFKGPVEFVVLLVEHKFEVVHAVGVTGTHVSIHVMVWLV